MPKPRKHKPLSDREKAQLAAFHADYATRTPRPVVLYGYKHRTAADAAEERLPLYTPTPLPKPQTPDRFPIMTTTKTPPTVKTIPPVTPVTPASAPVKTHAEYKLVRINDGFANLGKHKFEASGEETTTYQCKDGTTVKFVWDTTKQEWTKKETNLNNGE